MTFAKLKLTTGVLALATLVSTATVGFAWAIRDDSPPTATPAANSAPQANPDTAAVLAQRERPARPAPAFNGWVVSVAKDNKSFIVTTPPAERGGEWGKTTVKFAEKATVTYNGVGPGGAKPTENYLAAVWFEGNSKELASAVVFTGAERPERTPNVLGIVVKGSNKESLTLDVPVRDGERRAVPKLEQRTIPCNAKTLFVFSNVTKDGAKFTAGYSAMVWYADDGKTAALVQLAGATDLGQRETKRPDLIGKVARMDGTKFVVDVPPAERGGKPTRYIFSGDKTTVTFRNVGLNAAKIAPGMQVQVWLSESKDTAAKAVFIGTVPERWTTVTGKVVAVAKDSNSFTVEQPAKARGEEPKRTEITLTAKTKQVFFGVGPGGAKITEGMTAQARLLDGSPGTASLVVFGKSGERPRGGGE